MDRKGSLKIALTTLGCKVNQSDSAALAAELAAAGHQIVPFSQPAEVTIIHTCTVTQKTDYQSRQIIRRAVAQNPGSRVIVAGCYARVAPEIIQSIPGVDYVVGPGGQGQIAAALAEGKKPAAVLLSSSPEKNLADEPLPLATQRTRAYMKVQDGCNSFCSYCIVPFARGRSRSLPLAKAVAKARLLAAQNFREIVLTGIHLGAYGEDLSPSLSLLELLRELESEPIRLRLSSVEPGEFTPPLIDFLGRSQRVCPHLHIPLQSGDDEILRRMNRNYSRSFFKDLVGSLARTIPELGIGVDVIGGFPGETEDAFQNTVALIEELPIATLHVFPFSKRPGTSAERFPDQLPAGVIKGRCQVLRDLGSRKRRAFYQSFLGRRATVLVESRRDRESGWHAGYARNYIPVLLPEAAPFINREVEVELTALHEDKVVGKILEKQCSVLSAR